jgi:hypothetical protein
MANGLEVEISPLVAVVQYFKAQPALTNPAVFGEQIATRHKYKNGWNLNTLGLTIKVDPGMPDLYVRQANSRFECRIYGQDFLECDTAYKAFSQVMRNFQRCVVATNSGDALIGKLIFETTPSSLEDPDLNMPFYLFFLSASVAEQAV